MYIPLMLLLTWFVLHFVASSPVDQKDNTDMPIVGTRPQYIWKMKQLGRCFLWSKTLPYQERLDYLLALQRKVLDIKTQRKEPYKNYVPFDETEDSTDYNWVKAIIITIVGLILLGRFWCSLLNSTKKNKNIS